MYRLFKVKKSYLCKAIVDYAEGQCPSPIRACSLCTKFHAREFSTNFRLKSYHASLEAAIGQLKKKRSCRTIKTASELLSVTENSTRQRTATVTKLKPKDISRLVEQPETSLDQLHRLKFESQRKSQDRRAATTTRTSENVAILRKTEATYCNEPLARPASIPHMSESGISTFSSHSFLDDDNSYNSVDTSLSDRLTDGESNPHLEEFIDEGEEAAPARPSPHPRKEGSAWKKLIGIKSDGWKRWLSKFKQMEMDHNEDAATEKTRAHLQILVNSGSTRLVVAMLANFKRGPRSVKFIRGAGPLYDTLLEALARKSDLERMLSLIDTMECKHVDMTTKSYSCLFECLARDMKEENDEIIQEYMAAMERKGFKLDDIFVKADFVRDQRAMVLAAIRRVKPNYCPPVFPVVTHYSVKLLKNIDNFGMSSYVSPAESLIDPNHMRQLVKEQVNNEINGFVRIPNIWCRPTDHKKMVKAREIQAELLEEWEKALMDSIQRYMKPLNASTITFANSVLHSFNISDITKILIQEASLRSDTSDQFSPSFLTLKRALGQKVKEKYDIKQMALNGVLGERVNLYHNYCTEYLKGKHDSSLRNTRHLWSQIISNHSEGPSHLSHQPEWPAEDLVAIGAILYSFLLKDCKVNASLMTDNSSKIVPAFYTVFRAKNRRLIEELKPHPALSRLFHAVNREYLTMDVGMVPMTSPPVPWDSVSSGAHILHKTQFVRMPIMNEVMRKYLLQTFQEKSQQQYYPCFDSLNQLASIPWSINSKVLDVITDVFTSGGCVDLAIPLTPTECPQEKPLSKDLNGQQRYLLLKERAIARRKQNENYALWCEVLYRLCLAHHFRNRVIWLPHNIDFRGRVYPIAPYLQHMSGDMARSLLCFAQGQPLGPDGLDWLKIHLVNLTGLKSRESLADRLEFANAMLPDITDSAKNPMTGRKWWMESENPWQTLAVCFEIVAAIESGDPDSYVGHFPVHQDGSCNGLQHYAALGRDAAGARSVNLCPEDKPQDVYSCIGEIVESKRQLDAEKGVGVAKDLEGFIRRKVIKQTIMTTVYGVTRYGARLQIAKQLNALKDFDKEKVWAASAYLTQKTFDSLGEIFTSTKEIQDWLTGCASVVSKIRYDCVQWETPLGLLVIQPYFKPATQSVKAAQGFTPSSIERPNSMKQKNAFPPNFIHSLDSSHMMLTGLHCERAGITFVSVHDCFWVHPRNVQAMNQICREQFLALHSEPILKDLSRFLRDKYGFQNAKCESEHYMNHVLSSVPERGTFDLREVLKSVYFFS